MESVIVAAITGVVTLVDVLASNSRSRAITECKIDELSSRVDKHNRVLERTFALETRCSVIESEISGLQKQIDKEA